MDDEEVQNSETFLLSNMSPQHPDLNRGKWRELESAVRELDAKKDVLETYVITGPVFAFEASIEMIGEDDRNGVTIPVPSHFYKCVLTEDRKGRVKMWAFEMKNETLEESLDTYRVSVSYLEQRTGIVFWDNMIGPKTEREKKRVRSMW